MKIYRSETEVRISHTKKCDRQRTDRGHSHLEKALLALKKAGIRLGKHSWAEWGFARVLNPQKIIYKLKHVLVNIATMDRSYAWA